MNYTYSKINRLEEPHNYMYTPYHGIAQLQSYVTSRMEIINRHVVVENRALNPDKLLLTYALPILKQLLNSTSCEGGERFQKMLEAGGVNVFFQDKYEDDSLIDLSINIENLNIAESISTLNLLHTLISAMLTNSHESNIKLWIDRLVQRFEVTKYIYESYMPGFRKGEGENSSVRLYWLFALVLSLFYSRSNEIKYLSTLLKLDDLLCSLPESILNDHIPLNGLSTVLAAEIISIQLLSEKKGISFASN